LFFLFPFFFFVPFFDFSKNKINFFCVRRCEERRLRNKDIEEEIMVKNEQRGKGEVVGAPTVDRNVINPSVVRPWNPSMKNPYFLFFPPFFSFFFILFLLRWRGQVRSKKSAFTRGVSEDGRYKQEENSGLFVELSL
jgi:hypothetical protein